MAGFGSRFAKAGYKLPKYRIEVFGRPLFDWSLMSLSAFQQAGWTFSFAVRAEDDARHFIEERCHALGLPIGHFLNLDSPTDGQATTGRLLAEMAAPDQPFAIFNIDTFVRPGSMAPQAISSDCGGWVPCFPGEGDKWSFVRVNESGVAVELREKVRISPHATVGFYWFKSAELYLRAYRRFFAQGGEEMGERYVAPMYNQLIADGQIVRLQMLEVGDVGQLGTPEQVADFERMPPPAAVPYIAS
ncbi:glycosyltransferase family 2 protein [Nitrospirillum sp. BR 11752]|uniref:glycosyltransferase family 2 protein n=1 Tax=Nitrospirillum sp. BR 11752 TaxID=3104293 RepID=UPI002EA81138|nr:glycosyltransferase family 2 protein [Nitrospirillum sp. BR 11752]